MYQSTKTYPPREFPNLPSLEESLDLWYAQADRYIPKWAFRLMASFFLTGMALLLICLVLSTGRFELTINGRHRESEALWLLFVTGFIMSVAPTAYFLWVNAKLPPIPTRQSYQKAAAVLRLYSFMKADEERQE